MSRSDVAISVQGLSKSYRISHSERHSTLAEALVSRLRRPFSNGSVETFHALKNVNFDVRKGEVIGIIGHNGAGKSTLLKILSRITNPNAGQVQLQGRVGSLLEVGTGFHPELTGRENIYLNGQILGMRRKEIDRQFDAIVEFSEVERFLDTPVKRYSSGMYVRLAFSVAAHMNTEILVVDEVLAVGDGTFQKKCMGKVSDVARQDGRTVLFVSHNMAAIQRLCSRCILLERGEVKADGECGKVIVDYLTSTAKSRAEQTTLRDAGQFARQKAFFTSWNVTPEVNSPHSARSGGDITINLHAQFRETMHSITFGLAIWSDDGVLVWHGNTEETQRSGETIPEGEYKVSFNLQKVLLKPGTYWIETSINTTGYQLDRWRGFPALELLPARANGQPPAWHGLTEFDFTFDLVSKADDEAMAPVMPSLDIDKPSPAPFGIGVLAAKEQPI